MSTIRQYKQAASRSKHTWLHSYAKKKKKKLVCSLKNPTLAYLCLSFHYGVYCKDLQLDALEVRAQA